MISGKVRGHLRRGDAWNSRLFQFDRLVCPGLVQRRSPDLVRGLVLGATKTKSYAEAEIDAGHGFEGVDQFLGVELWTGSLLKAGSAGRTVDQPLPQFAMRGAATLPP